MLQTYTLVLYSGWKALMNSLVCILYYLLSNLKKNSPETGYRWFSFPKNVNRTLRKRRLRSDTKTFRPDKKRGFSAQTVIQSWDDISCVRQVMLYMSYFICISQNFMKYYKRPTKIRFSDNLPTWTKLEWIGINS